MSDFVIIEKKETKQDKVVDTSSIQSNLPTAFGLNNTGAICHFNSLLQCILSCKSIYDYIADMKDDSPLNKTLTGREFIKSVRTAIGNDTGAKSLISSNLISALMTELSDSPEKVKSSFGSKQESASEGLALLLETMKFSSLFRNWYNVQFLCSKCEKIVSSQDDTGVSINLFFMDELTRYPDNPKDFAQQIYQHISKTDADYKCPECKVKVSGWRLHTLKQAPPILVCMLNAYDFQKRGPRYFPLNMKLPGINKDLSYHLVGQIEHSGSLNGGHYVCRAMRKDNVYYCNDISVSSSSFSPSSGTYMLFYQKD